MNELRLDYIRECADLLASYAVSISEAAYQGNPERVRAYFDCLRLVGRDINRTLSEIEAAEKAKEPA